MTANPTIWTAQPQSLLASRNKESKVLRFPPFPATSPLATAHETVSIGTTGHVYSFTTIHPNPKSGAAPFALGYVDMAGPVRVFGRIVGDVAIGSPCEAEPDDEFGYLFHVKSVL